MNTQFKSCIPIITVRNLQQAKEFYTTTLGFKVSFEVGNPLSYLGLFRNEVEIHLNDDSASRQAAGTGNISILTNEVDNYYTYCVQQGVTILITPDNRDYGLRDFGIRDPDGNVLNFACDL